MALERPEVWTVVAGWDRYAVSTHGRVKRIGADGKPDRILKTTPDSGGYSTVTLYADGRRRVVRVHVLVAETFLGPRPFPGAEVLHWNDDRSRNDVGQLRYGTRAENARDMVANRRARAARPQPSPGDPLCDVCGKAVVGKQGTTHFSCQRTA
jgi:hypothetical protein